MGGQDGRVYVSRIKAGASKNAPKPTIQTQITTGSLIKPSQIAVASSTLGLTQKIYNHLVFNTTNNTADIREVTPAKKTRPAA